MDTKINQQEKLGAVYLLYFKLMLPAFTGEMG